MDISKCGEMITMREAVKWGEPYIFLGFQPGGVSGLNYREETQPEHSGLTELRRKNWGVEGGWSGWHLQWK